MDRSRLLKRIGIVLAVIVGLGAAVFPMWQMDINGTLVATAHGAKGDGFYSGDGVHAADGVTNGTTTFVSATMGATSALIGDSVFIHGAGSAGALYAGTITAVTNSTHVTLNSTPATNVTNAKYVIGFDNTSAINTLVGVVRAQGLQAQPIYFPPGVYLHRGLNFTNIIGLKITGSGDGFYDNNLGSGGSALMCVSPTSVGTPGTVSNVCHDFSGGLEMTIRDIAFMNGPEDDTMAGFVNALFARLAANGSSGNGGFAIENEVQNVMFRSMGGSSAYGVVIYGAEQTNWLDDIFNWDFDTAKALYVSESNTPGFTSPWQGALDSTTHSQTVESFEGGKQQFSSNGTNAITFDGPVNDINIIGGFFRLNGANDVFIADSGSGTEISDLNAIGVRGEIGQTVGNVGNAFMKLQGVLNASSFVGGFFVFNGGVTRTAPDFQAREILGSSWQTYNPSAFYTSEIVCTGVGSNAQDNYYGNISYSNISGCTPDVGTSHSYSGILASAGLVVHNGGTFSTQNNGIANTTPTATFADSTDCGTSTGGAGHITSTSTTNHIDVKMGHNSGSAVTECFISFGSAAHCANGAICTASPINGNPGTNPWQVLQVGGTTSAVDLIAQTDMKDGEYDVLCTCY